MFWTDPLHLFDAESCFPVEQSLALGEPALSLGIQGMPAYLLTREPIAIYNLVLMALPLISGLSLYWIVKSWTGVPAAGLVAGLNFAFHPLRMYDPVHFYVYDSVWTALALFFAQRLFAHQRWRDVVGFCCATFMQLAGSLYPLMMAAVFGIPFLIWLIREYGVRSLRIGQVLFIAGFLIVAAGFLFSPFLEFAAGDGAHDRRVLVFRALGFLVPGKGGFPGWLPLVLLVCAFALPARLGLQGLGRDPRWTILTAIVICYVLSFGSLTEDYGVFLTWKDDEFWPPAPFMALARVIPGLGLGRSPGAMFDGSMVILALLMGIGAAAIIRRAPIRFHGLIGVVLVVIFFAEAARPSFLGPIRTMKYTSFPMRPPQAVLDLYAELEAKGNAGPLLQIPATPRQPRREAFATLLAGYHERRTGQCYNSFHPPAVKHVREVSAGLPSREAVEELREIGFTTLVVVYPIFDFKSPQRRKAFEAFEAAPGSPIREVARIDGMTAYEILEVDAPEQ
jgi:hypothetical protein